MKTWDVIYRSDCDGVIVISKHKKEIHADYARYQAVTLNGFHLADKFDVVESEKEEAEK